MIDSKQSLAEAMLGIGLGSPIDLGGSQNDSAVDNDPLEQLSSVLKREVTALRYAATNTFIRGRPAAKWNSYEMDMVNEVAFTINDMIRLESKDQIAKFLDGITPGMQPLYTRLMMATGMGKTTKLPWKIAQRTGKRVLLLVPSVALAQYAYEGIKFFGGKATVRSPTQEQIVVVQTYADFVFRMAYGEHRNFRRWGVSTIIIDECHDNSAYAFVARAIIAARVRGVSVILSSATQMRQNMQASKDRIVKPVVLADYDLSKIAEDPRWLPGGEWAQDRMCVLLPTDDLIYTMRDKLTALGHIPYLLDSASLWQDVELVQRKFSEPSMVPRILLALPDFGTGFSLNIGGLVDGCCRVACEFHDGQLKQTLELITVDEKIQHVGRITHREGSGRAWQLSGKDLDGIAVRPGDRMLAWLLMHINFIRPSRSVFADHARVFGTEQLTAAVASQYFTTPIPPEIWHMFRAADGFIAKKYRSVVQPLAYEGFHIYYSDHDDVTVTTEWFNQAVGGYYQPSTDRSVVIQVPAMVPLRYKPILHGVIAMAEGLMEIEVPPWRYFDADTPSDVEETVVTVRCAPRTLTVPDKGVKYRTRDTVYRDRVGFTVGQAADINTLKRRMTFVENGNVRLEFDSSKLKIPISLYKPLAMAEVPSKAQFLRWLDLVDKPARCRLFVTTEIFDHWSCAWDAILVILSDVQVLGSFEISYKQRAVNLLIALTNRFDRDIKSMEAISGKQLVVDASLWTKLKGYMRVAKDVQEWIRQPRSMIGRVAEVHTKLQTAARITSDYGVHSAELGVWLSQDVPWQGGILKLGSSGDSTLKRFKVLGQPGKSKPKTRTKGLPETPKAFLGDML